MAVVNVPHFICITVVACLLQSVCSQMDRTCLALQQFVANTNSTLAQCSSDVTCTMVNCNTVSPEFSQMLASSKITLQPCTVPPSVLLAVMGPEVMFNRVLDSDAEVHLIEIPVVNGAILNVSLIVKVDPSVEGEIEIETDLQQVFIHDFTNVSVTLLNGATRIPLDQSECPTTDMGISSDDAMPTSATTSGSVTDGSIENSRTMSLLVSSLVAWFLAQEVLLLR